MPNPPPGRYLHSFVMPGLANAFEMLRVSAAISETDRWRSIHYEMNVAAFETPQGVEEKRDRYNERAIQRALREKRVVRGQHAGMFDCFAPIIAGGRALGVLVSGPFATARPNASDVSERWHGLTGRQAHLADPEFSDYLAVTLSTLVLEGNRPALFEQFLADFARLMAGEGDADKVLARAETLRDRLEEARHVDRLWEAAGSMLDERTERSWLRPYQTYGLSTMGLSRAPDTVAVGLIVSRASDADPIDEWIRRDAFQRACTLLARSRGEAISGKVGDHGVTVLSAKGASPQRRRERLLELGEQVARLARRHGFELHLGLSSRPTSAAMSSHYQAALAAAQSALSRGQRLVQLEPSSDALEPGLGELSRDLCKLIEEQPLALPARFERYLEAVALHAGYRIDPSRAYLESSHERLAATLRESGVLDQHAFVRACREVSHAAREARTIKELFAIHRLAVSDLSRAVQAPVAAHRERNLRRAVAYIHEHYAEPLSLIGVSRVAGFAPNYFSRLFKQRERMTFAHYLRKLRTDRAKSLLETTDLDVRRVAKLSGFPTSTHFATVFKSVVGKTPVAFRKRQRK